MDDAVSVVITACNRPELLKRTFSSLMAHNTYRIEKYIVIEDSQNTGINDFLRRDYPHLDFDMIYNGRNIGQMFSIDRAYALVDTPYVFHCEEDWVFYNGGFIEYSMDIMKDPKIIQCWLRDDDEIRKHPLEPELLQSEAGFLYHLVGNNYTTPANIWHGFTLNPHLMKMENYHKIGGYSRFQREWDIDQHVHALGFKSAKTLTGFVEHIGWNQSTDPKKNR